MDGEDGVDRGGGPRFPLFCSNVQRVARVLSQVSHSADHWVAVGGEDDSAHPRRCHGEGPGGSHGHSVLPYTRRHAVLRRVDPGARLLSFTFWQGHSQAV